MAGRPKKAVPPSDIETAIQKMEAKIAAAQAVVDMYESALTVLLEVSVPAGRVTRFDALQGVAAPVSLEAPAADKPRRSHKKRDKAAEPEKPADSLDL